MVHGKLDDAGIPARGDLCGAGVVVGLAVVVLVGQYAELRLAAAHDARKPRVARRRRRRGPRNLPVKSPRHGPHGGPL